MSNGERPTAHLERWGCPMDDSTNWKQSSSGGSFVSPDGIVTEASWLPCVSGAQASLFLGTCEACELFDAGLIEKEPSRSIDAG
jgi:hypothetical protein